MASSLTWLDHSERQRRRMMEIVHLFREPGTVDELGIGLVRDALSDTLFPGTSTLHTRARYLLFIPWIYLRIEGDRVPPDRVAGRLRDLEIRLIYALERGGEDVGVIGIAARENLSRFPSSVYWNALRYYGIRRFSGSMDQYHRSINSLRDRVDGIMRADDGELAEEASLHSWHASLPPEPQDHDFLEETSFELRPVESEYLQDRIFDRAGGTYLAHLVRQDDLDADANHPWLHPAAGDAPARVRGAIEHARCFSELLHGAALLYNLMLAEAVREARHAGAELAAIDGDHGPDDLVDEYRDQLDGWRDDHRTRRDAYRRWSDDLVDFWMLVEERNPRIRPRTRDFVERWVRRAIERDGSVTDDEVARQLVRSREIQVKRGMARLENLRALERWSGASGTGQLGFRWGTALQMARDIVQGLR